MRQEKSSLSLFFSARQNPVHLLQGSTQFNNPVGAGAAADMRAEDDVVQRAERAFRRQGLVNENIQTGAGDAIFLQRSYHRVFVDDAAAGDIGQTGAFFHQRDLLGADHALGFGRMRRCHADVIALAQQVVEIAVAGVEYAFQLGGKRLALVVDIAHAHDAGAARQFTADLAHADDAEGLARDFAIAFALRLSGIDTDDNPYMLRALGNWLTFLDRTIMKDFAEDAANAAKTYYVTANPYANVRSCASTNCDIVATAENGEALTVIDDSQDWYEIRLENGETAFIAGFLMSKTKP